MELQRGTVSSGPIQNIQSIFDSQCDMPNTVQVLKVVHKLNSTRPKVTCTFADQALRR